VWGMTFGLTSGTMNWAPWMARIWMDHERDNFCIQEGLTMKMNAINIGDEIQDSVNGNA
jgi:hypothetical protein